ncbi:uncharacterized protein LOC115444180 [Manduca sexta]|uniref:uncharacterized protein LOC115444180 n=1 Tax=Manduca sexta TaxID=7130 RepID=UPI0011828A99|nr:uncharacterized protein LOC115444180 [Manduca sexta]
MSVKREMPDYDDPLALQAHAAVGRLVDSNQADDRKMIRLVRERPLLYARNNMPVASYYTQVKLLWQEVADEMGWSVADVRRKWSHVRNSYSRHLRNEIHGARTGKGRMVSRWYLADELNFLKEHMATDMRSSPYSTWMELSEKTPPSERVEVKPFLQTPWFALPAHAHAHTKLEPDTHTDDSSGSHTFEADENSAYFQFFRGIHNDYQELPARKQRLFRRQCLQLLHALLDEDDSQSDAMNLSSSGQPDELEQKVCVDSPNTVLPH